jgi:hypothetical protein
MFPKILLLSKKNKKNSGTILRDLPLARDKEQIYPEGLKWPQLFGTFLGHLLN